MRHKLSLRIPGAKELSPPPPASARLGSPRRNSGYFITVNKPSFNKNSPQHSSSYNRIISNANIQNLSLPEFLRSIPEDKSQKSSPILLGQSLISTNSECLTDASSENMQRKSLQIFDTSSIQLLTTVDEFIQKIYAKTTKIDTFVLKIGKFEINPKELQIISPGDTLSRNLIDACLLCLKHQNKSYFKEQESHDRVMILPTNFSQNLFTPNIETKALCRRNPLKFEYVLFPLYIGFWVLLALDNRNKKLLMFNVNNNDNIKERIFIQIKDFIRRELMHHEKCVFEATSWKELRYDCINIENANEAESSLIIIRVAYKIAINNKASLSAKSLSTFRYNLLQMLFKSGTLTFR